MSNQKDNKNLIHIKDRWLNYFINSAFNVAEMSTCLRKQVGCIIIKNKQIISMGYNGAPSGIKHCYQCPRENLPSGVGRELCIGVHAEQNAISLAAKYGKSVNQSTAFVTLQPCSQCMKLLINAGINKIIYIQSNSDNMSEKLAKEAGIILLKFEGSDKNE